jgi:hypothetical protein
MMNEKIEAKKAEIANYERILREYQSGRWMDMGRRRLAELKAELVALETEATTSLPETT